MYDVVVAGAGPAGCTAAKVLAEKGYSVLLAERYSLPRYKSCSGILIRKSMDLVQRYFGENVPDSVTCTPADNRGMIFTDDTGREFCFGQEGKNVWRSSFDFWLTAKAVNAGVKLLDGTEVVSCKEEQGYIAVTLLEKKRTNEPESPSKSNPRIVDAKYVIDCEGATGVLKRKLTGCAKDYITTYQTFCNGKIDLDYHYFYAYLQPELSEYDAWFNVKDGQLVLGVAVKDTRKIKAYYKRFLAYMEAGHGLKIERVQKEERWLMPRIQPGCPVDYGIGRILFAGENAGFLNPMGEGISAGMESGFLAACAVAGNMGDPVAAQMEYKEATRPLKSYMERQWGFVAQMSGTFREMG